jgi:hypothetical protein
MPKMYDDGAWLPQLSDSESVAKIEEAAFAEAMGLLKTPKEKWEVLEAQFKDVAITHAQLKRKVQLTPPAKWHREAIKPIRQATLKLLYSLRKFPERLVPLRLAHHSVSGATDLKAIETMLEELERLCAECLRRRGAAGAKEKVHVEEAVRMLTEIWDQQYGKPMALSLDRAEGELPQEFTYPGPRFIQVILQSIDPACKSSEIKSALRKVLGQKRKRKPPP